jgi:cysteine protease ATG4
MEESLEVEENDFLFSQPNRMASKNPNSSNWRTKPKHIEQFLQNFKSLIWFCYRKDFPPLEPSQLTTDIGWGCMLRTGTNLQFTT